MKKTLVPLTLLFVASTVLFVLNKPAASFISFDLTRLGDGIFVQMVQALASLITLPFILDHLFVGFARGVFQTDNYWLQYISSFFFYILFGYCVWRGVVPIKRALKKLKEKNRLVFLPLLLFILTIFLLISFALFELLTFPGISLTISIKESETIPVFSLVEARESVVGNNFFISHQDVRLEKEDEKVNDKTAHIFINKNISNVVLSFSYRTMCPWSPCRSADDNDVSMEIFEDGRKMNLPESNNINYKLDYKGQNDISFRAKLTWRFYPQDSRRIFVHWLDPEEFKKWVNPTLIP